MGMFLASSDVDMVTTDDPPRNLSVSSVPGGFGDLTETSI